MANTIERIIDLDATPFIPKGLVLVGHKGGGQFKWNPARVSLYLSEGQRTRRWISGVKLREELKGKPVLNANVLDFLLANPELIPEEWTGKYIFFWGTSYRYANNDSGIRYLRRSGREWNCYDRPIRSVWFPEDPAAVLSN